jgi:hypothetical protein
MNDGTASTSDEDEDTRIAKPFKDAMLVKLKANAPQGRTINEDKARQMIADIRYKRVIKALSVTIATSYPGMTYKGLKENEVDALVKLIEDYGMIALYLLLQ